MQNQEVINEWDEIVITLLGDEKGKGSIRMRKADIDAMVELHGEDRSQIFEMLVKTLETTPKIEVEGEQDN
jgi:hypothetical protein